MMKKVILEKADRIYHLPPDINDFLPRRTRTRLLGHDVIDLARLEWPARDTAAYPAGSLQAATDDDIASLAEKTAEWYGKRFEAKIKSDREVFFGHSVRTLLNLTALAFLNPGDVVLIPDPGVWHYRAAAALASAETIPYHLTERNRFQPTANAVSAMLARMVRAMILNSPHNPTGTIIGKEELAELVRLGGRENMLLILDHAFEGFADGRACASLYGLPGGRKVALELYSFAYNFGRPAPSAAFAVGQPAVISGLRQTAAIFGLTMNRAQVMVAHEALADPLSGLEALRRRFSQNREILDQICRKIRLTPVDGRNGPYYWAKLPGRRQSRPFGRHLYLHCGLLAVPGIAFGENGEGYLRFSLTGEPDRYQKALEACSRMLSAARERENHG